MPHTMLHIHPTKKNEAVNSWVTPTNRLIHIVAVLASSFVLIRVFLQQNTHNPLNIVTAKQCNDARKHRTVGSVAGSDVRIDVLHVPELVKLLFFASYSC